MSDITITATPISDKTFREMYYDLLGRTAGLQRRIDDLAVLLPTIRDMESIGADVQARPLWDDAMAIIGGRA